MRTILCSSALITLCLSRASLMHLVVPSAIQTSNSSITVHWTSPIYNFLLDIGYCLLCPDTCGGGNTLWISCSNALEKWRNCAGSFVCAMCIKSSQNTSSMVQNGFTSNRVKNLLHSFVPHMITFLRRSSSDIVIYSNGFSSSVTTRL